MHQADACKEPPPIPSEPTSRHHSSSTDSPASRPTPTRTHLARGIPRSPPNPSSSSRSPLDIVDFEGFHLVQRRRSKEIRWPPRRRTNRGGQYHRNQGHFLKTLRSPVRRRDAMELDFSPVHNNAPPHHSMRPPGLLALPITPSPHLILAAPPSNHLPLGRGTQASSHLSPDLIPNNPQPNYLSRPLLLTKTTHCTRAISTRKINK